jgi:hypothetical protein
VLSGGLTYNESELVYGMFIKPIFKAYIGSLLFPAPGTLETDIANLPNLLKYETVQDVIDRIILSNRKW